ncbi:MAG: hypothetical protein ACK5XN_13490 [Bacteroidota bacterium]
MKSTNFMGNLKEKQEAIEKLNKIEKEVTKLNPRSLITNKYFIIFVIIFFIVFVWPIISFAKMIFEIIFNK